MNKISLLFFLIFPIILLFGCSDKDKQNLNPDGSDSYQFPLASNHHIDEDKLIAAYEHADDLDQLHCLLLSRDGVLISEAYFHGSIRDSLYDIRSVTKSVTTTLIGIAIDKGYIDNINQTVGDYISPEIYPLEPDKASISIKNLIRMSSGIPWKEIGPESEFNEWVNAPNQVNYILDKEMTYDQGTQFNYSDGNAHLVSVILTEASGMNSLAFAEMYLFEPMEINDYAWYTDKQGFYYGGVTMDMTAEGLLKFGQLYLDKGMYKETRIVTENWISEATESQISTENIIPYQNGYGYFWWTGSKDGHDYYFANGYGGQFIVVIPDQDVVIVALNQWIGISRTECEINWGNTMDLIVNEVMQTIN